MDLTKYEKSRGVKWLFTTILLLSLLANIATIYILIADRDRVAIKIQDSVEKVVAGIPKPQNGVNGINGLNATDEQVERAVAAYMREHPVRDGKDGKDGRDGRDGRDGNDSTVPGPKGDTGEQGPQGEPGPIAEWQCNPTTARMEYRYPGNEDWTPTNSMCIPLVGSKR